MIRKLKKYLITQLQSKKYFDVYIIYSIQLYLLNRLEGTRKKIFQITKLSDLKPLKKILNGYEYISIAQDGLKITVPDLNVYEIKNAVIHSRSSAIIKGKNIYYESINDNERFNEGHVISHTHINALIDLKSVEEIEEGFFLAGNGSFNWYHWLTEILPKMVYFKEIPVKTILVDESYQLIPSMMASLKIFTDHLNVKIIDLDKSKSYKIKKLYFINEVNKLMYNDLESDLNIKPLFYYRKESLDQFRETFFKHNTSNYYSAEKIYLQRKNTHRIAENESQIWDFLQQKKFTGVDLLAHHFSEQISIFENAKIIVGTTGAAFTNLLFCKPYSHVIIFMPDNYKNYNFYQELGLMLDLKVNYLYYENGTSLHDQSNFKINLSQLKSLLESYEDTTLS